MGDHKRTGMLLLIAVILFIASSEVVSAVAPGWSEPATPRLNISDISTQGIRASLIQDGNGTYWMVREGTKAITENNNLSIFSSIDGINWSTIIWITNNSSVDGGPSIINDSSGKYWVSWYSDRTGNGDIYVFNSSDGVIWSTPLVVDTNSSGDSYPSLLQDRNGTFWVAWRSPRSGSWDVWIANSSNGSVWNLMTSIDSGGPDGNPSIMQDSNSMYWLTWSATISGNTDIYISNSTNGTFWTPPTRITTHSASDSYPSLIQAKSGKYHIAFYSERTGNRDIWIMDSINGVTWTNLSQITVNNSEDQAPSLIQDKNGTFWLAWESDRLGGGVVAIFLSHLAINLTSPIGNETLSGIYNITWNVADVDRLNNTFDIYYNTTNGTNWTLITSGLNNTTTHYLWDTTTVPDGTNYTVKVTRVNSYAGNATYMSGNFSIDNPLTPISNLQSSVGKHWINWTWSNPGDANFSHVMVYMDGVWKTNTSAEYYLATGFIQGTSHMISTRTVDASGNINSTWVNDTATTATSIAPGWSEPVRVTPSIYVDDQPSLLRDSNGVFWIVYSSGCCPPGSGRRLNITNSSDGINWSQSMSITDPTLQDFDPSIIQASGKYWVAFYTDFGGGVGMGNEIMIMNSTDGVNWDTPSNVTTNSASDIFPSLIQDAGGKFWIAWRSEELNPEGDIRIINSSDGYIWNNPIDVTNDAYIDSYLTLLQDSAGKYWVMRIWDDGVTTWVNVSNSSDGCNWSEGVKIPTFGNLRGYPQLIQDPKGRYLVTIGYNKDIYWSVSSDGLSWPVVYNLTTNSSQDMQSSIVNDINGTYWIAWASDRYGVNRDILITHSTVTLTSPNESEVVSASHNISWVSISGDYTNDSFTLYYSDDGGDNWSLIQGGIPADDVYTNNSTPWNISSLADGDKYRIKIVRTHSWSGHNETDVSGNFTIDNPLTPISNLQSGVGRHWINWTWSNPGDANFSHVMVYLDGTWKTNTSAEYYLATGFIQGTSHTISTRTVDASGNINQTWVNDTATTATSIAPGWSEPMVVANINYASSHPSMIQDSNQTFWIAFPSFTPPSTPEISIINSTDGINWNGPIEIANNSNLNFYFGLSLIQDSAGKYWIAFDSPSDGGTDREIRVMNSTNGINWSEPINVTDNSVEDMFPSLIEDSGGKFWVAYETELFNPGLDVVLNNSSDGVVWSDLITLDNDACADDWPSLMQDSSGKYWVMWIYDDCTVPPWIYISNSTDGVNWSTPIKITEFSADCSYPDLIQDKKGRYVAVFGGSASVSEIFWSTSTNGVDWGPSYQVTTNVSDDETPSITQDANGTYWITWSSKRLGTSGDVWLTHSTVTLTSPNASEVVSASHNISWVSISGDYTNDSFSLYYSDDGGGNWTPIQSGIPADDVYTNNSSQWDISSLADGDKYRVKIVRTNSWSGHNETDISGNFTIDKPDPSIIDWSNNKTSNQTPSITINESEAVTFNVTANQSVNYSWYNDGVDQNWNYDNNTTSWAVNGTYKVNASVSNLNGSSANKSWSITVNDIIAPIVYNLTNDTPMQTTVNLSWSCDDTDVVNYSVYQNGTLLNNTTNKYYNVTGLDAGITYEFNVSAWDDNGYYGANDTISVTTSGWPPPSITSWGNNKTNNQTLSITINESEVVNFNVTADQNITTYSWYKDDVDQGINYDNFTTSWSATGSETVAVNATNANGTSDTITWNVTVQYPTCSAQGGNICSSGQSCSGSWTSASDTSRCCIGSCYTPSTGDRSRSHNTPTPTPTPVPTSTSTPTPSPTSTPTPTPAPTPVVVVEVEKQIEQIEAGKSEVVTFEEPTSDISEITINVKNDVSGVEITIRKLSFAPPQIKTAPPPRITGAVVRSYSYLNISTTNITDDDISNASINFTVNKSWILEEEIDEDHITLHRYNTTTNNWTALNTSKTGEDNTSVYYEAQTPGFSIFVITGEKKVEVIPVAEAPTPTVPAPTARPWMPDTYTSIMILIAVAALVAYSYIHYERKLATPQQFRKIAIRLKRGEMEKGGDGKVKKGGEK